MKILSKCCHAEIDRTGSCKCLTCSKCGQKLTPQTVERVFDVKAPESTQADV